MHRHEINGRQLVVRLDDSKGGQREKYNNIRDNVGGGGGGSRNTGGRDLHDDIRYPLVSFSFSSTNTLIIYAFKLFPKPKAYSIACCKSMILRIILGIDLVLTWVLPMLHLFHFPSDFELVFKTLISDNIIIFIFASYSSLASSRSGGRGDLIQFNQSDQNHNTYGLSASFLNNLGIQPPLHNKIFVANVSIYKFLFDQKLSETKRKKAKQNKGEWVDAVYQ